MSKGWIGVDLDGTLARNYPNMGQIIANNPRFIGEPIPPMVARVKNWLEQDIEVRIFTARAACRERNPNYSITIEAIKDWCLEHLGQKLPVVAHKDWDMIEYWDDRAVAVQTNTGGFAYFSKEKGICVHAPPEGSKIL